MLVFYLEKIEIVGSTGQCVVDIYASEDTKYLKTKLVTYCDMCQLHLLCNIVELQYVGTDTYDTHRMLHDIYLAFLGLKVVSKVNEKNISLTLDDLYKNVIEFLFILSPNATT